MSQTDTHRSTSWPYLCLILCVGATFRFYDLEGPSQWADEIQACLGSQVPLGALWEWIIYNEVHPPTFHLLLKFLRLAGDSDFVLRLASVVCGTATIWVAYRIGRENLSENAGLAAASLMAGNAHHVWLSRLVRPYGVLILLCFLSVLFFLRILREPARRDFAKLLAVNAGIILLHLNGVLILAAQSVFVLGASFGGMLPWRMTRLFAACTALCFVPVMPVIWIGAVKRPDMVKHYGIGDVAVRIWDNVAVIPDFYNSGWSAWIFWPLFVVGAVMLILRNRWLAGLLAAWLAVPAALIITKRYMAYLLPMHLSFMLPALAIPAAAGLAFVFRGKLVGRAASLALLCGLGAALLANSGKLYGAQALTAVWWNLGNFKQMARGFGDTVMPGSLVAFDEEFMAGGISWYLDQFSEPNPITANRLFPEHRDAVLALVTRTGRFGEFDLAVPVQGLGTPDSWTPLGDLKVASYRVPNKGNVVVDRLPFVLHMDQNPQNVLGWANSLSGMKFRAQEGWRIGPTLHEKPCHVEYVLENSGLTSAQHIFIGAALQNVGKGNTVRMDYQFDGEPTQIAELSSGKDRRKYALSELTRVTPWQRLTVRFELTASWETPAYGTGALDTLSLSRVDVAICNEDAIGPCSKEAYEWLGDLLRGMSVGSGWLSSGPVQQQVVTSACFVSPGEEASGWSIVRPKTSESEASLTYDVYNAADVVFYPRVGGGSSVRVYLLEPGGGRRELFNLLGKAGAWTPLAEKYPLVLPGGTSRIDIVLQGPWAQLWVRGGAAVFSPR